MNPVVGVLIGLLVGWLIEWIIDWLFWRRRGDDRQQEKLMAAEEEIAQLKSQLIASKNAPARVLVKEKDSLEKIKGIGAVFTKRFNDAGVYTFAELAALTVERAREIINPEEWQAIDPESWIAEARQFVDQQKKEA
jgi:predicted flap endonuclease-1-like 5' DNA nuclease